jgi:hypothetical protein
MDSYKGVFIVLRFSRFVLWPVGPLNRLACCESKRRDITGGAVDAFGFTAFLVEASQLSTSAFG